MTYSAFKEICNAIKADDSGYLNALRLEPDGRYQTVTSTLGEMRARVVRTLALAFEGRVKESFPHLAVSCGKCRVGSTALTNLFGIAGYPSYYQPVKTIMRFEALGQRGAPWNVPEARDVPFIHCKEMTGPYLLAECLFNPIDMLISAGYPSEKITLIVLDRSPQTSLDSWLEKWTVKVGEANVVQHYVLSALNAARIARFSRDHGIRTINYVYEATKMPHEAVAGLLRQLGLEHAFSNELVENWGDRGALESSKSMVRFPVEPDPYIVVGFHASETEYKFKPRTISRVTPDMNELLIEASIYDVYEAGRRACFQQLGIEPAAVPYGR